ncbi:MAG: capsular biosynthesis protein [Bacteroidetes bacterium GWF2_38_335]|nr:MAG: capsular biosynthesis protein [Bacteroidetes bacterium GWF2_38_335]HBS88014.1 capsular biosynthesis protein [Bacteroidales bacterium]
MIPFSPPKIDQKVIDEVSDALRSGWITTGPKTKLFEKKIAEYCKAEKVLCVNSATAGLELVLRWFGVKEGDEVIVPAYTYCATANVVVHCGAKPVMADINPDDFCISVKDILSKITEKTKVIIPVDIAGFPCDYDSINSLVNSDDIKKKFSAESDEQKKLGRILVLSDAAHSIGAVYKGKKTGALTDITVFSFHAVKNLTTAEGGAIVFNLPEQFNKEELYNYFNILTLHGQTKDALAKSKIGQWRYDVIFAGYKANMTDLQAAIGLAEIDRYDEETITRRKAIFDRYSKAFSKYSWAKLPVYEDQSRKSSYHVYLLRINNITETQRDEIITRIFEREVSVNVHFQPLPLLSVYKQLGYKMEDYPVSYQNYSCEISLPVYFDLTDEQVDVVVQAVVDSVE